MPHSTAPEAVTDSRTGQHGACRPDRSREPPSGLRSVALDQGPRSAPDHRRYRPRPPSWRRAGLVAHRGPTGRDEDRALAGTLRLPGHLSAERAHAEDLRLGPRGTGGTGSIAATAPDG